MRIAELVATAGASYVARWTTYNVFPLMESMQNAFKKKGFSFIEILSPCPTAHGRRIGMREGQDYLNMFKEKTIKVEKAKNMSEKELEDRIVVGKFVDRDREEFTESLRKLNKGRMAQ
jgi:2-oxoglutarate ferredoxin oxidoreductase subunit beta